MSTTKVEGSIGQPIVAILDERKDEADSTHFTRLMVQALPGRADSQLPNGVGNGRTQRYCVVGGRAHGVVCEASEWQGEVHLKVKVPQYALYKTWQELAGWLTARLNSLGYPIVLEVEHVQPPE